MDENFEAKEMLGTRDHNEFARCEFNLLTLPPQRTL